MFAVAFHRDPDGPRAPQGAIHPAFVVLTGHSAAAAKGGDLDLEPGRNAEYRAAQGEVLGAGNISHSKNARSRGHTTLATYIAGAEATTRCLGAATPGTHYGQIGVVGVGPSTYRRRTQRDLSSEGGQGGNHDPRRFAERTDRRF